MDLDKKIEQIHTLIDLMEEKNLVSLDIGSDAEHISLTRHVATAPQSNQSPHLMPMNGAGGQVNGEMPSHQGSVETAPMVGVFYVAPSPSEPPFVTVGQKVQAGDTLGIIEAMKIMNPLEATQSGIIDAILVADGDVVQFDQPIVRYKN